MKKKYIYIYIFKENYLIDLSIAIDANCDRLQYIGKRWSFQVWILGEETGDFPIPGSYLDSAHS